MNWPGISLWRRFTLGTTHFYRHRWSPVAMGESRSILWGGLILAAAIPVSVAWLQYGDKAERIRHWSQTAQIETRMLAAHAEQSMTAVDVVLRSVVDYAQNSQPQTAAELVQIMGTPEVHQLLRLRQSNVAQIGVISIVALNGNMINFTRNHPPRSDQGAMINLAERDYFKAHLGSPNLDSYLSAPVKNKGTGTWTFYLTRKIRNRANEPIGLVLAGVEAKYFEDFYRAIALEKKSYTLFRADGINLARYPLIDNALGGDWISSPIFQTLRANERSRYVPSGTHTILTHNEFDGRVLAPVRLDKFPLVVNVRIPDQIILEAWHRNTTIRVSLAILVWLVASAFMLMWHMQAGYVARQAGRSGMLRAATVYLNNFNYEARQQLQRILDAFTLTQPEGGKSADSALGEPVVASSVRRIIEQVDSMVAIAQIEAGDLALHVRETLLGRLIETEVLPVANPWFRASNNEFAFEFDDALIRPLMTDAGQISQMILRSLAAACDNAQGGKVRLRVRQVGLSAKSVTVMVEVSDSGDGFEPSQFNYLLDPLASTMAADPALFATGIAIAHNRALAGIMSGTSGGESAKGVGSRHWFTMELAKASQNDEEDLARVLKMSAAPIGLKAAPDEILRTAHPGARLLLVQRLTAGQSLLRPILESLGLRVDAIDSCESAIKLADQIQFDLILIDLNTRDLSSIETIRRIRLLPSHGSTPVIGLTASDLPQVHANHLDAGMDEILTKPARICALAAAILKWLDRSDRAKRA